MHPRGFIPFLILLLGCGAIDASQVSADIVCPDSSYATVQFTRTFTGVYRPGQPRDVVTVGPGGIDLERDDLAVLGEDDGIGQAHVTEAHDGDLHPRSLTKSATCAISRPRQPPGSTVEA